MCLVSFYCEVVLDSLDGQVLAKGTELVVDIFVVGLFSLPLALDHAEGFFKNGLWTYISRVRGLCHSKVSLFDLCARSLDCQVLRELIEVHAFCYWVILGGLFNLRFFLDDL